jgi:hypothetical protein
MNAPAHATNRRLMMGFFDKAKAAAEQAAVKAKEGVEVVQTKRELSQARVELGKATFELLEGGEIQHDRLTPIADKIRALQEQLAADVDAPAEDEAVADQAPAPPT